ncbi:MAG: hypothetical protein RBR08_00775 [Desulforegulaceae bacterium]|jgi:aspartate aminotransferase-like enzyme|nr:hypothetical protein [Desulforegulaceae bacterium]
MKSYVVDSLNYKDFLSIKEVLTKKFGKPFMDEIFQVTIDSSVLAFKQKEHTDCGPHYFSLSLEKNKLTAEMLVRSKKTMRCSCMGYADDRQILWLIGLVNDILQEAGVKI